MERSITYSLSSLRNFHLSVKAAVEQDHLSWLSSDSIHELAQTFFTHQDLHSNNFNFQFFKSGIISPSLSGLRFPRPCHALVHQP